MTAIRSLVFNTLFYALLIVMMVVGFPILLGGQRAVERYARLWAKLSLRLFAVVCAVKVEIRHRERLPTEGAIVAVKHQSFLDILALLSMVPRFVFVLKRELTWIPGFGQYLKGAGMIPIDRAKGRGVMADLTTRVRQALGQGRQLIIFPEGTRRPVRAPPAYKSGVAHLYAGAGVTCVPVALNSGLFWPRRSFLRYPGHFIVEVLPPMPAGQPRGLFMAELQRRIETASDRLIEEADPTHPAVAPGEPVP